MIIYPTLGKTGRLGNQLWEIAATVGIGARHMEDVRFPYWEYTEFFNVSPDSFCAKGEKPEGTDVLDLPDVAHLGNHKAYLQDYSLVEPVVPLIRRAFQPSVLAEIELARSDLTWFWNLPRPKLALHVRRGDNATSVMRNEEGYHPLRPVSYYVDALHSLSTYKSIVVFSDDLPWCREHIPPLPNVYSSLAAKDLPVHFFEGGPGRSRECEDRYMVEPARDWIDLFAMADCDQFVLSNSTYSWWAAFLSGVDGSQIRYPDASVWFGPKLREINASLMFPPDWVPILHDQV